MYFRAKIRENAFLGGKLCLPLHIQGENRCFCSGKYCFGHHFFSFSLFFAARASRARFLSFLRRALRARPIFPVSPFLDLSASFGGFSALFSSFENA